MNLPCSLYLVHILLQHQSLSPSSPFFIVGCHSILLAANQPNCLSCSGIFFSGWFYGKMHLNNRHKSETPLIAWIIQKCSSAKRRQRRRGWRKEIYFFPFKCPQLHHVSAYIKKTLSWKPHSFCVWSVVFFLRGKRQQCATRQHSRNSMGRRENSSPAKPLFNTSSPCEPQTGNWFYIFYIPSVTTTT